MGIDLGLIPAPPIDSICRSRFQRRRAVRARAGGLAAPWWDSAADASFTGMTAVQRPRASGRAPCWRHRRPGGRVG